MFQYRAKTIGNLIVTLNSQRRPVYINISCKQTSRTH